jgi:4-hydroxybenzoate polyprenyltransferase
LKSVKDCWWWFVNGCWITGGAISLGLGADYLIQYLGDDTTSRIAAEENSRA